MEQTSALDLEPADSGQRRHGVGFGFADMALEFAFLDGFEEGVKFGGITGGLKFDAAVREVANPSDDLEPAGKRFHREPEADALNAALVEDLSADHAEILRKALESASGILPA
jgi:hypothetical protein